ncbi:TetR/AcrR family transcriptional regulator [Spongiibacter taiwanensis]
MNTGLHSVTIKRGRTKSEEKREQIIAAASALFLEQGYESCSMEEIAKLAGVSKQTLYSHFGSKEVLFSTAVEVTCARYHIWDEFDADTHFEKRLEAFCINFSELLVSREATGVMRACIADAGRSQVAALFWQAGPAKLRRQLSEFLAQQHHLGTLHIDDIKIATTQLIAMLHSEHHTCSLLGLSDPADQADLRAYARSCARVFIAAYETRPA